MTVTAAHGWLGADWGSVPAWFGAVLTGGSLLLGFYIILRDRRKGEYAEALLVATWLDESDDHATVTIHNTSQRTIVDVWVHGTDLGEKFEVWHELVARVIRPDQELPSEDLQAPDGIKRRIAEVSFQDADGVQWRRNMTTKKLSRSKFRPPRLWRTNLFLFRYSLVERFRRFWRRRP